MIKDKKSTESRADLLDLVSRYQQIIEISPHGIQENDMNGLITLSNPAHTRMHGYEDSALVGKYIWDMAASEEDRNNTINYFKYLVEVQPPPTPYISKDRTKNGNVINVRIDWDYKRDEQGSVVGFISVITDETELVAQEEALLDNAQRFRDFTDTAADLFWETDANHRLIYVSNGKKNLTRRSENMLGRKVWEIDADDYNRPAVKLFREKITEQKPITDIRYYVNPSKEKRVHLKVSALPIFGKKGEFSGYRGTIIDETQEIEAKLHDENTQNLMAQCFQELPEGIIVWDQDDRLVTWNDRYRILHSDIAYSLNKGITFEEFIRNMGKQRPTILDQEGMSLDEWVAAQIEDHHNLDSSLIVHRNNAWIKIRKFMLSDGSRVAYHTDITKQKQADDAVRKLGQALEQCPNLALITDTNGVIEYVNRKFTDQTGYSSAEAIGRRPNMLQSGVTSTDTYKDLWKTIESGQVWRGEFHDKRKDGSSIWFSASISPVFNSEGEITHYVNMSEDITLRKKAEIEILEAKEQAEIANRAKSEFLASMSHELRTPLNAVIGFSELMRLENMGPLGNEKYREYLDHIKSSGSHLLSLINDILDTSVIEAEKLILRENNVNLYECVELAQNMVSSRAEFGGVILKNYVEKNLPDLLADELRMKQILVNLLSNAVKFTPVGGTVSVHSARNADQSIDIIVSDTGIGMNKTGISKALEKFGQVIREDINITDDGTGLGLPLAKSLVEAHGGQLTIKSEVNAGTTVSVRFPNNRILDQDIR